MPSVCWGVPVREETSPRPLYCNYTLRNDANKSEWDDILKLFYEEEIECIS